jgi:DNA-directed RNA polymerase specialized sigma24 family protein
VEGLALLSGDSSFSTWLYRVALNTALTWRRGSARRQNEIAGVTGLSQSAVGVRIHRMKKVFAERYGERST